MVSNSLRSSSLPWADKTLERLSNIVTSFSSVIRRPQELAKIQTSDSAFEFLYTMPDRIFGHGYCMVLRPHEIFTKLL